LILESEPTLMTALEKSSFSDALTALGCAEPSLTADGFVALHGALFGATHGAAGQIRDSALAWNARNFAHAALIASSLEQHFATIIDSDDLGSLSRDDFFDVLAHHISELHAISPFRFGNRRTLALHAAQIAHAAGYGIEICGPSKNIWDEALTLSFVHKDYRAIACLLKGLPFPVALFPESLIGISGLPILPERDASLGRRYQRPIARTKRELEDYLPEAQDQAMAAVIQLTNDATAPRSQLTPASQELGFLRHPKGPIFQAVLLDAANYGVITPALHDAQSALERVREIATAINVGIAQQTSGHLEFLIQTVCVPEYGVRGSPHQDRLATLFLANTAEQNHGDPRLAAHQRALDDISATAKQNRSFSPKRIAAKIDQARREIAARIRSGEIMMADGAAEANARLAKAG
jgi:cell filamentation protein